MDIPTGLFVIATTGSLFGGIVIGMSFLHLLGKFRTSDEEKRKKEEENRQKIDEWRTNLEKQGYEVEPSERYEGQFQVTKTEKITGSVKDFYNRSAYNIRTVPVSAETVVRMRQYKPEMGRYVKVLLAGTPPVKKGQYLEMQVNRYRNVEPLEKVEFEPLETINSGCDYGYDQVLYVLLKDIPGDKPIWTWGKYKPKVDRKLTEFK
jgi:uncharacterized protein YxeA